jgi:hypothetical protein
VYGHKNGEDRVMKKLKVGQRIDIYKVLTDGCYTLPVIKIGGFRPAIYYSLSGSPFLLADAYYLNAGVIMIPPNECRKVGTMIVTKLK